MKRPAPLHNSRGFTIVELLIVIIVIGILAALVLVAYNNVTNQAKVTSLQADLTQAGKQLGIDKERGGGSLYPATLAAANGNNGLSASGGATYTYYPYPTTNPTYYCLQDSLGGMTYSISSTSTKATQGDCTTSGMVGQWLFNGNANDSLGTNNGTATNATLTAGQSGATNGAYALNGTNAYLSFGNGPTFNSPNLTISAWVKPANLTGLQEIAAKELQYKFRFNGSTAISVLYGATGNSWTTTSNFSYTFTNGTWYHIVLTVDSANLINQIYVNGSSIGSNTIGAPMSVYNTNAFYAGSYNAGGELFNGSMDDLRFYNRVLSTPEIQALYTAGAQ